MNYSELTDFEINKRVAEALGYTEITMGYTTSSLMVEMKGLESTRRDVDYCNNPSDAWPIILENRIDIQWSGHSALCLGFINNNEDSIMIRHDNPLRAAMIVFLMMKESEQ